MSSEEENSENQDEKHFKPEHTQDIDDPYSKYEHEKAELKKLLQKEKQNTNDYIEKWKRALADYENLKKRSELDVANKVSNEINKIMLNFLTIYEDLIRAKNLQFKDQNDFEGFDGIIKNMESIFNEYNIKPIVAIGQTFNPNLHEAVSIVEDESLDDDMIKDEIAKGYISGNIVIKPSKVIVSKKSIQKSEKND